MPSIENRQHRRLVFVVPVLLIVFIVLLVFAILVLYTSSQNEQFSPRVTAPDEKLAAGQPCSYKVVAKMSGCEKDCRCRAGPCLSCASGAGYAFIHGILSDGILETIRHRDRTSRHRTVTLASPRIAAMFGEVL
jgi:hypothetical protein